MNILPTNKLKTVIAAAFILLGTTFAVPASASGLSIGISTGGAHFNYGSNHYRQGIRSNHRFGDRRGFGNNVRRGHSVFGNNVIRHRNNHRYYSGNRGFSKHRSLRNNRSFFHSPRGFSRHRRH